MKNIKDVGICWDIQCEPVKIENDSSDNQYIELSWGWTAGMSEEQIKELADDCPTGHDSVVITRRIAEDLIENLQNLLDKMPPTD